MNLVALYQGILNLGTNVLLPILVFVIALVFGVKPSKAVRAALLIAIGFIGLWAVMGLMFSSIPGPVGVVTKAMGFKQTIVDVDWPVAGALAWASPYVAFMLPLVILLNLLLLWKGFTKTLMIDVWNMWHFMFRGGIAYAFLVMAGVNNTVAFISGLVVGLLAEVVVLKFADWSAPWVEEHLGQKGISFPTMSAISMGIIGWVTNWVIERIPAIREWNPTFERMQERFGLLGQPIVLGVILGTLLQLWANLVQIGQGTLTASLSTLFGGPVNTGVTLAAVMFLVPRMVGVLLEGLRPIAEGAQEWMRGRFKGKEMYVGMDFALGLGDPGVITVGMFAIVFTLILVRFPGNSFLPLLYIGGTAFSAIMPVIMCKRNLFRATVATFFVVLSKLLTATFAAGTFTYWATTVGALPASVPGGALVSSAVGAGEWDIVVLSFLPAFLLSLIF
jgi:PTS system galactitol-specific IIC component